MNPFAPDEAWWAASRDPVAMFQCLRPAHGSARKWRLLLCAGACHWLPFLTDPDCREALETAELFADGVVPLGTLMRAAGTIATALRRGPVGQYRTALEAVQPIVTSDDTRMTNAAHEGGGHGVTANLLREVFGYPFARTAFPSAWRTATAIGLARAMYDHRDFAAMPVLADVLEEAGCDHAEILSHCRGDGPHVRGCWVVDLVLEKS